jgi:DNA-binding MarR family transcriptional regulator
MLLQTRDTIWAVREKEVKKYGLSNIEVSVLFIISAIELSLLKKATPIEISRWVFRKPSSITELLDRMQQRGLIIKNKEPNRKAVNVEITEKGRQIYHEITQSGTSISRIMQTLNGEEQQQLWNHLSKLRGKALDELETKHKPPSPGFFYDPYS